MLHNIIVLHRAREVEKWRRNMHLVPVLKQAWENCIPGYSSVPATNVFSGFTTEFKPGSTLWFGFDRVKENISNNWILSTLQELFNW